MKASELVLTLIVGYVVYRLVSAVSAQRAAIASAGGSWAMVPARSTNGASYDPKTGERWPDLLAGLAPRAGDTIDRLTGERWPDLVSGATRPPAGATWNESQAGWVTRDEYGNALGLYT